MPGNRFGQAFSITTFGESHGAGVGVVIDGCPAGLTVTQEMLQNEMIRRKPGQSKITTQRKEADEVQVLSGVLESTTLGSPVALFIPNQNQKPKDYSHLKNVYRPSHADYTYEAKYGIRDYRGGGRSSARETAARVAAGVFAKALMQQYRVSIRAYVAQVGHIKLNKPYQQLDLSQTEESEVRCPDPGTAEEMIELIRSTRKQGDTVGGAVKAVLQGCPVGLGEPVYDKLEADLGKAMLSINAAKGFTIGSGFSGATMYGSQHNDIFENEEGTIQTQSNHSGGVQGGISNGMDITFDVPFKPVSTLMQDQESVNNEGETVTVKGKGRHDPCVVPRAVPIVEAMAAIVVADHLLRSRLAKA